MARQETRGRYHHVFVTTKGAEQKQALFVDLTASELKTRFVRPYRQGKAVLLDDGSVVETRDITWSHIRATQDRAGEALARLEEASHRHTQELNRGGNVLFMGRFSWSNVDLIEEGENLTQRYITSPPGEAGVYRYLGSWLADNLGKALITFLGALALTVALTWLGLKKV